VVHIPAVICWQSARDQPRPGAGRKYFVTQHNFLTQLELCVEETVFDNQHNLKQTSAPGEIKDTINQETGRSCTSKVPTMYYIQI